MGALTQVMPLSRPTQSKPVLASTNLPRTFQEALSLGWSIVKEESSITINNKRRSGVVLLRLKNALLRIPYEATAKKWQFGKPEPVTTE